MQHCHKWNDNRNVLSAQPAADSKEEEKKHKNILVRTITYYQWNDNRNVLSAHPAVERAQRKHNVK